MSSNHNHNESPALTAIQQAAAVLIEEYVNANPKSAEAFKDAKASGIAGGTNRASIFYNPFPLTFVNASEATAVTADGQQITDFLGNYTAGLFGFSPDPVKLAVIKAMENGHALGGAPNLTEARVAKQFTKRFPSMDMVRFSNTGTEANSYAIHTARAVTGKNTVMMYDGAYHGAWIHGGKAAGPLDTPYEKITVPYGDADLIARAIAKNAVDLAALIIEPVSISPMVYLKKASPPAYLQKLRETCDAAGCALIFDEVMTSRLAPGGAQALLGITPDLTTFGKYYGGGLPFGGFGGKRKWMERHDPAHPKSINSGGTFNQNAICLAAVEAVFENLWSEEQCTNHNAKAERFKRAINELAIKHDAPCRAYGTGSLLTIIWQKQVVTEEHYADNQTKHELNLVAKMCVFKCAELFWFYMLQRHNILAGSPKLNYLTLPTTLKDSDYDHFLKAMAKFFEAHKTELAMLSAETKAGLEKTPEEVELIAMSTTPYDENGQGSVVH